MKINQSIRFLGFILLISFPGCDPEETLSDPDLRFKSYETIFNPCSGLNEYLDIRNFYWTNNGGYPFNGYPPIILLYYRPGQGFFDCNGFNWVIFPPAVLTSLRYFENSKDASTNRTRPARNPGAKSTFTTVTGQGSNKNEGPIVEFPDLNEDDSHELKTQIAIDQYGHYILDYEVDPVDNIEERDETNNTLGGDYMVERKSGINRSHSYFEIKEFTEKELSKLPKPYIIYSNGNIEVVE